MYPRYLMIEFKVRRRRRRLPIRSENPQKMLLYEQVVDLRRHGYSYPAIARELGISVGNAWNLAKERSYASCAGKKTRQLLEN